MQKGQVNLPGSVFSWSSVPEQGTPVSLYQPHTRKTCAATQDRAAHPYWCNGISPSEWDSVQQWEHNHAGAAAYIKEKIAVPAEVSQLYVWLLISCGHWSPHQAS